METVATGGEPKVRLHLLSSDLSIVQGGCHERSPGIVSISYPYLSETCFPWTTLDQFSYAGPVPRRQSNDQVPRNIRVLCALLEPLLRRPPEHRCRVHAQRRQDHGRN